MRSENITRDTRFWLTTMLLFLSSIHPSRCKGSFTSMTLMSSCSMIVIAFIFCCCEMLFHLTTNGRNRRWSRGRNLIYFPFPRDWSFTNLFMEFPRRWSRHRMVLMRWIRGSGEDRILRHNSKTNLWIAKRWGRFLASWYRWRHFFQ